MAEGGGAAHQVSMREHDCRGEDIQVCLQCGEVIPFYFWKSFDWSLLGIPRFIRKGKKCYCEDICALDIETTTLDKGCAWCYLWQFCIGGYCIYGRKPGDLKRFLKRLVEERCIDPENKLCIWVHNLGYEFQYLKNWLHIEHVFAAQPRKPIRVSTVEGLEFRCSWKLTNKSLQVATRNQIGVNHPKQEEKMDFSLIRYPDTPLTMMELSYSLLDVLSLYEYIRECTRENHDTLISMPCTSTGYIRRKMRIACSKDPEYRKYFLRNRMTVTVYKLLRAAARGGNTHANRAFSGRIMEDIDSYDKQSAYPAMMMLHKFPSTAFTPLGDVNSLSELEERISDGAALLFTIILRNPRIYPGITIPYIPYSKCEIWGDFVNDNGRVLYTGKDTILKMTITDVDWSIIKQQYQWDNIAIQDVYASVYDWLPEPITRTLMEMYQEKCELKEQLETMEVHGQEETEEYKNLEILYAKKKNEVNGIFGMMYTDPVRAEILFQDGEWSKQVLADEDIEEALEKFYKSRNSFLTYAHGVWITAWARREWQDLINDIGDGVIYGDTDSGKGVISEEAVRKIETRNEEIIKACEERKAYGEVGGVKYYLGVNEREKHADRFITLGAKKYAYETGGKLKLTVSGVSPEKGAKELGCLENFKVGFKFTDYSKGPVMHFIDRTDTEEKWLEDENGTRHLVELGSAIAATPGSYLLGLGADYESLLNLLQENDYDLEEEMYYVLSEQ